MCGSAARVARTALMRLISNDACQSASVRSSSLRISRAADVVDEHVETPVPLDRLAHDALGLACPREVGRDVAAARGPS